MKYFLYGILVLLLIAVLEKYPVLLIFLLIAFLLWAGMVYQLFRQESEARSLIVPERINQEMLEILFEYNVFANNNWVLTKGYVQKSSRYSAPCAVYCGLEHGNVMLVNESTKHIIVPSTLELEEPFEGFTVSSWSKTVGMYIHNVSSSEFDKKIIKAAGLKK